MFIRLIEIVLVWCDKRFLYWLINKFEKYVKRILTSRNMPHYTFIQRRFLSHCDRVFLLTQQCVPKKLIDEIDFQWRSNAYHKLKTLYSNQNRMKKTEEMYVRALTGKEKAWNAKHTSTLDTVNIWKFCTRIKTEWKKSKKCTCEHWQNKKRLLKQ